MQLTEHKRKMRFVRCLQFTCILFAFLVVRVFYLQIVKGPELVEKALNQWTRETTVSAKRGSIVDTNGEVLAQSGSADTVILHPKTIATSAKKQAGLEETIANSLAAILDMDAAGVLEKVKDTSKYEIWLKRQITQDQADQIRALDFPGVDFAVDTKRYYPKGDLLTQTLGFTSVDGEGLEGLESYYNKYLTGTAGSTVSETDVKGNNVAFGEQYYNPPTDGYTVQLSIDYIIQSYVEKAAKDAYEKYTPTGIMCIAMDPNTGEILAMTNQPSYDLNNVPRDDADALTAMTRNRCVVDTNDPGSVFKVFTTAAALEENIANPSTTFTCTGSRKVGDSTIRCTGKHGTISLELGLAKSCNSVYIDLGLQLGTERLYEHIREFGFGEKTNVDFPSEASGILIDESKVKEGDLARIAFGQSITATPLQTLTAFCSIINGGELLEPHLLKTVKDADGNTIEQKERTVVRRTISESTSKTMREMMEKTILEGTGTRAKVSGYRIGGKSGTAQKYDENGKIKESHYSSFMAFAPLDDPQIAILFIVDEPTTTDGTSDGGGAVAAPYVGQILEETLKYMRIEPTEQTSDQNTVQVPNVLGMTQEEATAELAAKGLTATFQGEGVVADQLPAAGEAVKAGENIAVTLKKEEELGPAEMVTVPNLKGKTKQECKQALEDLGLTYYFHGEGKASWQNQKAGTEVEKRTEIRVEFTE